MLHHLLPLLPQYTGTLAVSVAVAGALVGAGLWLAGSRVSRTLLPLLAVALGGVMGMLLPRWLGWGVNSMATAVGGAVVFGVITFVGHTIGVAVGLGTVLALWAALGTWVTCDVGASWAWPSTEAAPALPDYLALLWRDLPERFRSILPLACAAGMVSGLSLTLLWPRVGQVLLYSAGGATLLVGMGVAAIDYGRPEWIAIFPAQTWAQLLTLAAVVAFGSIVQWQTAPLDAAGGGGGGGEPSKSKPKRPD